MLENIYVDNNVSTFGGYERRWEKSRVVVLGVPYDFTSSHRTGSRFAPNRIRLAAKNLESYSFRANLDLDEMDVIFDWGNLIVVHEVKETLRRLAEAVTEIIKEKRTPVLLGGEHTITHGVIDGLTKHVKEFALVVFDAHLDMRHEYPSGDTLTHATVMRRIIEDFGDCLNKVIILGVRAVSIKELRYLSKLADVKMITSMKINAASASIAEEIGRVIRDENIYLSIDLDAFDPSFSPGVNNPEIEGLRPNDFLNILEKLMDKCGRLLGFDVVELNPLFDLTRITEILAAKLVYELISLSCTKGKI